MCRISEEIYNEGVDVGIERGIECGIERERIAAARSLMDKLDKGAAEALALIGVPEEERDRYLAILREPQHA